MANVSISQVSASQYIGNPMVYRVTPTGDGSSAAFYRIKLAVHANITGHAEVVMQSAQPVTVLSGTAQAVDFDISSALRAVADVWIPEANTLSYPTVYYYLEAWEEWMIDGVLYENRNTARLPASSGTMTAYMGSLTDRERLTGARPARYSRKPTSSPEVVFVSGTDLKYLSAGLTSSAPSVTAVTTVLGASGNTYGIAMPDDGYEIRFINSFDVHENVFVHCLKQAAVSFKTDEYAISRPETLTDFSRGIAIKQNDREKWKMTTGPLDRQWQQWFAHEFLKAKWAWIRIIDVESQSSDDNMSYYWLQVHIIPEETTNIIDRTKTDLLEVPFTIEFDINGSPY